MGNPSIFDQIKYFLRDTFEYPLLRFLLNRHGFDFGVYWLEELYKMYRENEHKIKRT